MSPEDNTGFFDQDDAANRGRVNRDLQDNLAEGTWSVPLKVALACRKLATEGHAETLAGQVTIKANGNSYWTNRIAGGFGNLRQSTVIRIDEHLKVVEGEGIPNPGVRFHMWIYRARPNVNAIVHTHPPHASALSMTGRELAVAHMDVAMFYNDCAYLPHWPGVPLANEEGRIISEALGDKCSILLANHGLLTVGQSIEEAIYLAIQFERAARLQLLAEGVGRIKPVRDDHARDAHDFLMQESVVFGTFNAWAEELLRKEPDIAS